MSLQFHSSIPKRSMYVCMYIIKINKTYMQEGLSIMYKDLGSISRTTKTYTQILIVILESKSKNSKSFSTWISIGNLMEVFS